MNDATDLHALFADYAAGEIDKERLAILESALREDDELRRDFVEYMNIDSALSDLAALSLSEIEEFDSLQAASAAANLGRPSRKLGRLIGAVIAASIVTAFLVGSWLAVEPVARLVARVDATLTNEDRLWRSDELGAGVYQLERGLLQLEFGGGVMVYVEAPARFDVVSSKRVLLHDGRLSANVPPEGIGFTVETPEANVVDYGTEFSVDVETGNCEVHVFDGLVRVHPKSGGGGVNSKSVDLRTSEAIRIDDTSKTPVGIDLATDRFIRNFDEPKWKYPRSVVQLSPVAYYRMPIGGHGLRCDPPAYSGQILLGDGIRPHHAPGFIGASLRVRAESTGRGARVNQTPPTSTGQFSMAVFVYAESSPEGGTVVSNLTDDAGAFALTLDARGALQATVRTDDGLTKSCVSSAKLPLLSWKQIVVTADGTMLRLYENGKLMASTACSSLPSSGTEPMWIGTKHDRVGMWDGRIDELALYGRAINASEIAALYQISTEMKPEHLGGASH